MIKRILAVTLAMCMLAGCSAETKENELETVSIVLDWYPNAVHSFIYAAIENGYYEEEGIEVDIKFPANTTDPLTLVAAGQIDLGIYYLHNMIYAKAEQDVPIKSIGTVIQSPLGIFASTSGIKTPDELVGKTLGASTSDLTLNIIDYVMRNSGYSSDDVNVVDVGFDLMSAMTSGTVDATFGCMLNHEVPHLEKEGFEVDYFLATEYGMPNYYEMSIVVGDETLEKDKEKIDAFLRASKKGFDYVLENQEEALELMMTNQNADNFPLDLEVERESLNMLLPLMQTDEVEFLEQNEEVWQENIDWMFENNMISKEIKASDIAIY